MTHRSAPADITSVKLNHRSGPHERVEVDHTPLEPLVIDDDTALANLILFMKRRLTQRR